jgi:hypothetical protein
MLTGMQSRDVIILTAARRHVTLAALDSMAVESAETAVFDGQ